VAQVSAVAAQMFEANPALSADTVRQLLVESSLALPHLLPRQTGAGLIQPALAVAAALRAQGGPLAAFPRSGTLLRDFELQKWSVQGKLAVLVPAQLPGASVATVYLGCYAPQANRVSVTGSFNGWQPGQLALQAAANGWWHAAIRLPAGTHAYRFWIEATAQSGPRWCRDPENPACVEGGYQEGHSSISL
jgi:serine protease AprX